jgi:hypothetical protein
VNFADAFGVFVLLTILYVLVFYGAFVLIVLQTNHTPVTPSLYKRLPGSFLVWPVAFGWSMTVIFLPFGLPTWRLMIFVVLGSLSVWRGIVIAQIVGGDE